MRRVLLVFGLIVLMFPAAAVAQPEIPPPLVQTLREPGAPARAWLGGWVGGILGSTIALVGVNSLTGGALLTPVIGAGASAVLGGAWLGTMAAPAIAAQPIFESVTLATTGVAGGVAGYWLATR